MDQDIKGHEDNGAQVPHLSISSHVVVQLGAELVTDIEQALLELAKNAYDADSETCEIFVEPDWEILPSDPVYNLLPLYYAKKEGDQVNKVGRIRIRDYGDGIPESAVDLGWLRISASIKRASGGDNIKKKTKKERTPVGDKGLGRLATMKIGTILRLKTAIPGETQWRTVSFSWADFTPERTLDQVRVIKGIDTERVEASGTIIEIIGLHDPDYWRNPAFIENELVPNLSSLISPFQSQDNFSISVKAGTRTFDLETLHDDILNLASAKFEFAWNGKTLTQKAWIAPSLFRGASSQEDQERFDQVFSDKNKFKLLEFLGAQQKLKDRHVTFQTASPWLLAFSEETSFDNFPLDKQYPGGIDPGPFKAEIYSFMFNKATKDKLQQAGMSAAQMQAMANIAIYRDGFRVRAQKDWLHLSESSTKGGSFYELRPSNVLGYFALTNEFNPGLVEKSDREGFVDNRELRGFMTLSQRCKAYSNSILESSRRGFNDFVATIVSNSESPPSQKTIAAQLENAETESAKNIQRAKTTLTKAIQELSEARTTVDLRLDSSSEGRITIAAPLDSASSELTTSLKALEFIEEKLKEHVRLSDALKLLRLTDEEQRYRLVDAAAVGLTARSLSHELHHYIRQLREGVSLVAERNKTLRDEKIQEATKLLNSVTRELAKLVASIDPLLPGSRSLKENIALHVFLSQFVDARKSFANSKGIDFSFNIPPAVPELEIRFSKTRLLQVMENLFQNSVYWLIRTPLTQPGERKIVIEATQSGFDWFDTGPGISPTLESSIFDPFVSDKPSSEGQGLGLHIVSTFLEAERCEIHLSKDKNGFGRRYKFIVTLSPASIEYKQPKLFHGNE